MLSTAVLSICASLLGVLIGMSFQKYMNDRDKRFSAYIEMIEAIAESPQEEKRKDAIKKFISAKQKIVVYGSDEVIKYLSNMPEFNSKDKIQYDTYLELIARMRKETAINPYKKQISKDLLKKILGSN